MYAALVAGIVNVVEFVVELSAEIPCVTVLLVPPELINHNSTTLPAVKLVCVTVKSATKLALIKASVA